MRSLQSSRQAMWQTAPDALQPQKVWHQETIALGLITASMTTTAITKPRATTAAYIYLVVLALFA